MEVLIPVFIYYILINIVTLVMYRKDKLAEVHQVGDRIPERTLILAAVIGGGLGAVMGMKIYHNRQDDEKFKKIIPGFVLIHTFILFFILLQFPVTP